MDRSRAADRKIKIVARIKLDDCRLERAIVALSSVSLTEIFSKVFTIRISYNRLT